MSPGFAGLYSLWLHLDDDGQWALIVNNEPDIWGTMHDPAKDLGQTPLEHSIVEVGAGRSVDRLRLRAEWQTENGEH